MSFKSCFHKIEIEMKKLKIEVDSLYDENALLRVELAGTQQKLQASARVVEELEKEMQELKLLATELEKEHKHDPVKEDCTKEKDSNDMLETASGELKNNNNNYGDLKTPPQQLEDQKIVYEMPPELRSLHKLTIHYGLKGRHEIARHICKRALIDLRKTDGNDHPDVASMMQILALIYADQSKFKEAVRLLNEAMTIRVKAFTEIHPAVLSTLNNLIFIYSKWGKYKDAEEKCRQSVEILEQLLGKDHPKVGRQLNKLALILNIQDKDDEVEKCYLRSLKIFRSKLDPDDSIIEKTRFKLIENYMKETNNSGVYEIPKYESINKN